MNLVHKALGLRPLGFSALNPPVPMRLCSNYYIIFIIIIIIEQSERDAIRGGQLKIGYMFDVYIYVWIVHIPFKCTRS